MSLKRHNPLVFRTEGAHPLLSGETQLSVVTSRCRIRISCSPGIGLLSWTIIKTLSKLSAYRRSALDCIFLRKYFNYNLNNKTLLNTSPWDNYIAVLPLPEIPTSQLVKA